MQFVFLSGRDQLILPVTPESYEWSHGRNIEKINISQLGDVNLAGGQSRHSGMLSFLLPAHEYSFLEGGAIAEPQVYLDVFAAWSKSRNPVRYIITDTDVNALVYIARFAYGEHDGSRDVYVDLTLEEYVDLAAKEVERADRRLTGNAAQPALGTLTMLEEQAYTIATGDTLSSICRRYYGKVDATHYNALAKYNNLPNPHLIYPGVTIAIPPETTLLGGAA